MKTGFGCNSKLRNRDGLTNGGILVNESVGSLSHQSRYCNPVREQWSNKVNEPKEIVRSKDGNRFAPCTPGSKRRLTSVYTTVKRWTDFVKTSCINIYYHLLIFNVQKCEVWKDHLQNHYSLPKFPWNLIDIIFSGIDEVVSSIGPPL